jgi:hypothetical protein
MWALRVLNGASAGKIYNLKSGKNLLGRAPHCDIHISSNGISKEHCEIHVYPDKIIIADLRSSNGTFLNGVRIQSATMRLGDKLGINDVIFDIAPAQTQRSPAIRNQQAAAPAIQYQQMQSSQSAQQNTQAPTAPHGGTPSMPQYRNIFEQLSAQTQDFLEKVALPGIYKLPQWFEFRWVIGGFVVMFIFAVTLLSMIPTFRSAKESGIGESLRRAMSVARHLAEINQKAVLDGQFGNLSTHSAELEEGVKDVFIVQKSDGMILAPASRAGRTSTEPFVHKARAEDRPLAIEIGPTEIGASAPIGQFDPTTGLPSIKGYAIVIYDVSGMALDQGRAISLFMQILVIASVLGAILFFFLTKLIEKPVRELNTRLDTAMRERRDNIQIPYLYPEYQALIGNVNSLLSRSMNADQIVAPQQNGGADHQQAALNFVSICGVPAIVIGPDDIVWTHNDKFTKLTNWSGVGSSYRSIPDSALQQNFESLIRRCQEAPYSPHSDNLEFSGHPCQIQATVFMNNAVPEFYVLTIVPSGGDA